MPKRPRNLGTADLQTLLEDARENPDTYTSIADDDPRGLYACARRGGVEWRLRYRKLSGERAWKRLGRWPDLSLDAARKAARAWIGRIAVKHAADQELQLDPAEKKRAAEEQRRARRTVAEAVEAYLADLLARAESGAKRGRRGSYVRMRQVLHRNVLPTLGDTPLRELTTEQVRTLHRSMSGTPTAANTMLRNLGTVFEFAKHDDPKLANPCTAVVQHDETGERRALTRDELTRLGTVLADYDHDGHVTVEGKTTALRPSGILAVKFLALTGWRRSELLGEYIVEARTEEEGLRWRDVDLDAGTASIRTKTGRQVRALGAAALDLLRQHKPTDARPDDPVCPGVNNPSGPFIGINNARRTLYAAADIPLARGVDLHSLRHSFITIGGHIQNGKYAALIGPLCGHSYTNRRSITDRYIHGDIELLRPVADAVSEEIARLLGLTPTAEVVHHPSASRA